MNARQERVKETLDWIKENSMYKSYRSIAKQIGYNPSMISQVITGKTPVSSKLVLSLCSLNHDISYEWIWSGEGQMLKNDDSNFITSNDSQDMLNRFTIILDRMAQMMNNISMLVGPLTQDVSNLKTLLNDQNKELLRLNQEIKKIKAAIHTE